MDPETEPASTTLSTVTPVQNVLGTAHSNLLSTAPSPLTLGEVSFSVTVPEMRDFCQISNISILFSVMLLLMGQWGVICMCEASLTLHDVVGWQEIGTLGRVAKSSWLHI